MANYKTKFLVGASFWLSLLLHLLLFLSFSYVLIFHPIQPIEKKPDVYVPAYTYEEQTKPDVTQPKVEKSIETSPNGIEKPVAAKAEPHQLNPAAPMNISKSSEEPVHLIGDKGVDNPLLTLLGKALTKRLFYPKMALDFNVRGTAVVGFMLYPDGHITDAKILRSSGTEVLDKAVTAAVQAISPVNHVDLYLQQPKFLVIAIIFG